MLDIKIIHSHQTVENLKRSKNVYNNLIYLKLQEFEIIMNSE